LESQVQAQSTQNAIAATEVSQRVKQLELEVTQRYLPITIASAVAALLGITLVPLAALKYVRDRSQKWIDDAIYGVDPTHIPVHIPASNFTEEKSFLKRSGFYQLEEYSALDNTCLDGCVIVAPPVKQEEGKPPEADLTRLRHFITQNSPKLDRVGFVIYTTVRADPNIVKLFSNTTFANSPVTLGTNVFTVGRALIKRKPRNRPGSG
jgi:hypothetical protein